MSTNNITTDIADVASPPSYTNANVPTLSMDGNLNNLSNVSTATLTVNGVNIDSSEIGYVDGATPGTAVASKALVLDSSKNISGINAIALNGTNNILTIECTSASNRSSILFKNDNRTFELGIRGSTAPGPTNGFYIYDNAASAYRLVISSSGNVGIGLSSPSYKLDISGDCNATGYYLGGSSINTSALVSVTAGAASASKALVLDSSSSITGITALTSSMLTGTTINATSAYQLNGTAIFTSALTNVSDSTGAVASKALVLDSGKSITGINSLTSSTLIVSGTTASTSSITGALQVAGGVGVKGAISGGGNAIEYTSTARSESLINFTDTSTTFNNAFATTDATPRYTYYFGAPTYTGTTARTTTTASTLYISGSPISGTNNSITNAYALVVNSGRSSFGGATTYTTPSGSEQVISIPTLTLTASGVTTPDSIHRSIFAINAPTLTSSVALTTTNASTMYIAGPPASSGSMTITNPFSFYINSGQTYLGGGVIGKSWIGVFPSTNPTIDTTRLVQAIDSAQASASTRSITIGKAYTSLDSAGLNYSWTGTASSSNYVSLGLYGSSTFNNTLVVHGTGNVGIGTTTPSFNLDVSGTTRITGSLTVSGTGSHSIAGTLTATLASGAQTGITSVGTLSLLTVSGDITISSGKLTIGTGNDITSTIASYIKGVVLGSATASTVMALDASKNYSGINVLSTNEISLGGTGVSYTSASMIGSESLLTIGSTTLTNTSAAGTDSIHRTGCYIKQPTLNATAAVVSTTASTVFIDGPPLTTGSATITNRYALYAAGPLYTRGVSTFVAGSYTRTHQWANDNALPIGVELQIFNGSNATAANNAVFGTTTGNFLSFMTNQIQRMTLDISGNVGIGTTSPSYNLDVSGSSRITGASIIGGVLSLTAGTASTSTTTGSLVVTGGVGISGATYIGGSLNISGTSTLATTSISGIANITNGTTSTSTSTGALVVSGGVGIAGAMNVGGSTSLSGTLSITGITTIPNATSATNATTGALVITGGIGISGTSFIGGVLNISNSTASTTTSTGALVVSGGVGIAGALNIGSGLTTTTLSASGNATITGTLTASNVGTNTIAGTLASTNTTISGVLTVSGSGTHSVGGTLAATTLTTSGNTTITGILSANNTGTNTIAGTLASTNTTISGVLTVNGSGTHSIAGTLSAATLNASGIVTVSNTMNAGSNRSFTTAGTERAIAVPAFTYTNSTTAVSGTDSNHRANVFIGASTIAASNASVVTTNASTLYIDNAPSAGTNMSLTNRYALYVAAGNSYFGGTLNVAGATTLSGTLTVSGGITGSLTTATQTAITSVGTLTGLTISGSMNSTNATDSSSISTGAIITSGGIGIAKNLYVGTGIYGTIQTSSQPQITSLGALTGLTVGATTFTESELAVLDGVAAGTATNSKALILSSTGTISGISSLSAGNLSGSTLTLSGTTDDIIRITNTSSSGRATILMTNNIRSYEFGIRGSTATGPANGLYIYDLANAQYRFVISSSGQIGINTTGPAYQLDVNGTLNCTSLYINGSIFNASGIPSYCAGVTTTGTAYADKVLTVDSGLNISGINQIGATVATIGATDSGNYNLVTNGRGQFTKGIIIGDTQHSSDNRLLAMIDSTMALNGVRSTFLGKALSTRNCMNMAYFHAGDASTSNYAGVGFFGVDNIIKWQADSTVYRSTNATTFNATSDFRIKENIILADLDICYNVVKQLPLKYYKFKDHVQQQIQSDNVHHLGWIAQEVKEFFPKAVSVSNNYGIDDCLSINIDDIYKATYGAVQKLIKDKERLETTTQQQQTIIDSLQAQLSTVLQELAYIKSKL